MDRKIELKIFGKVQGVLFRRGTKDKARELGLVGWVQNKPDGSVFIVAEGKEKNLQKLVDWAKVGTEWTEVKSVEVEWSEATGEFQDFKII